MRTHIKVVALLNICLGLIRRVLSVGAVQRGHGAHV
jgi:hypothetical protein